MFDAGSIQGINMFSRVQPSMPAADFVPGNFGGMNVLSETNGKSFQDVLSGMVSNLNNEMAKPDQLLNDYMTGNGDVDIHDVMTAISKADLGVTMAAQATGKLVAAYNAVMNISI